MTDPHDDTDDTVTTWRDIADQLTAEQRAILSALERAGDRPDTLLFTARQLAAENLASVVMFSDVAPPPDAARLFGWQQDHGAGWFREFAGTTRRVGGIALHVAGRQFRDGRCERWLVLSAKDSDKLTPAQATDNHCRCCTTASRSPPPSATRSPTRSPTARSEPRPPSPTDAPPRDVGPPTHPARAPIGDRSKGPPHEAW